MMKKLVVRFLTLLLVLGMSVNAAWGQDKQPIYLLSMKANISDASTGSGQVRLTWLDIKGKPIENSQFVGDFPGALDSQNPTELGETAQMIGGTMFAMDGVESDLAEMGGPGSQIYPTSFVYFYPEGVADNGSYFTDWTFTDPAITRLAEPMGHIEYKEEWSSEKEEWVNVVDEEKTIPLKYPCFKVLSDTNNTVGYPMETQEESLAYLALQAYVTEHPSNIYGTFKKYLMTNPTATTGWLDASPGEEEDLQVSVEVEGDTATFDMDDFADDSFVFSNNDNGQWSCDLNEVQIQKMAINRVRVVIPVKLTAKAGITAGVVSTVFTVKMAGGEGASTLNIPISVNALDPSRPEAYLLDGKDDADPTSGSLDDLLAMDLSDYTNPILKLNKPVEENLTFSGMDFTLDLNGNAVQAISISSGNVTFAYNSLGGSATALTVNGGKAILNGGTFGSLSIGASGTVEQNGATITGAATNDGSLTTTEGTINGGLTSSKKLVMNGGTFKGTTAVTINGGTAAINRGKIDGTTCGLFVSGGEATIKKLAAIKGATYSAQQTSGTLTVESGKFDGPLNGTIDFACGYFKNLADTVGVSAGKTEMLVSAGVEYNEGYRYFLGTNESAQANGVGVCRIGEVSYTRLEDAIAYANNNPDKEVIIFMTNNYTLPAGYYTLPSKATLVVPMSDSQANEVNKKCPRLSYNDVDRSNPYSENLPNEYRRLTFANGVNMDVFGEIELTCTQFSSNEAYTSQPCGPYGHLVMEEGSHMTLQAGSELRAWGFMTGKGETDARRDATVREMFQMGDWKGAMVSVRITGMVPEGSLGYEQVGGDDHEYKIFPVTQYFIQNVESPVKYHPGAVLSTSATVSEGLLSWLAVSMTATDIKVIGISGRDAAIFLMDIAADAENTWVRKWYDAEHDTQVYDINSGAHIGSMLLDMGRLTIQGLVDVPVRLNSAKFDLPLTSNFKIHLLSGTMDFKQNTCLLPGAEVEVDKESTVSVAMDQKDKNKLARWKAAVEAGEEPVASDTVLYTGALYVYDQDDWGTYAYPNLFTKVVRYTPSANGKPEVRDENTRPGDATINVHGTFNTNEGFVYTSNGGANIFSSNVDAGTFVFNQSGADAGTRYVHQVKAVGDYPGKKFSCAKLKNGIADPAYVDTKDADAGDAYCYQNDVWSTMVVDEDNPCFMVEQNINGNTYYAKPQEYVAVVATKEAGEIKGNADHTYSDAAGAGRLFILMEGCQWWEVEKKDNLYHCIHPNNDTYYYWVDTYYIDPDDEDTEVPGHWEEKRFTITWLNWDGTPIETNNGNELSYSVTYGTMAEFLSTNPTREANIDYTYDFTGWTPALGPVTSDVTYTATFTQKPRKYTIIFQQEGGVEIERQFLTHNEVPVCENTPTKIGHTLVWSPAIAAVTGDATYTATWQENPPTEYEVTFFDYDGTTPLQQGNVAVGAMPEYTGSTPTGKATWAEEQDNKEFTYVFDHWSPALEEVSATSIKSYTAVYAEVAKTYTIKFVKENGDPDTPADVIESHQYQYGETPVCADVPSKAATVQYTYALRWTPQIQTVMADANYTAVFDATTNKYTVTLKANPSGACTFTGAGTFNYGTAISISRSDNSGYTFTKWTDKDGNTVNSLPTTITGDINLVANFTVANPDYKITWKNEAGTANLVDTVGQKAGTATIYTGAIPTKPATAQYSFTFDGWTTAPNGAGTFYKNNMTPKATANATYYAHFAATEVIMEVGLGQAQNIAEETTVNQLILNSNGTVSGQLTGNLNDLLNVTGVCYYDLTGTFTAGKWYAVAVPWRVTASDIRANGNALSLMSGDYLAYYDGSVRAAQGKVDACWKYLSNSDVLVPGRLYMLYLQNDASVLRFPKKADAPILNTSTGVAAFNSSEAADANWNGIANPAIFYAYLSNTGATVGQVFNADAQSYEAVALSNKLIVAKPIFVQATNTGSASAVTTPPASAPVRRKAVAETQKAEYQVEIASYGRMQDRLFIHMNEDKEADTYTIGQDVVKFGVSDKVAQMWVNRYDAKLCMNTMAPVNSVTEFPLSIFAPKSGEYTIAIEKEKASEDHTLYLTYNGEAIWNLSEGAYVANLNKGTDANYGLRISVKNAPQTTTGIDEAIVDAQGETMKALINNQVFIIRGEKVYTIDGQLVK